MDTVVLSQLPQECSFLPLSPQQHKEKLAFSSCIHSTASWFLIFFKPVFKYSAWLAVNLQPWSTGHGIRTVLLGKRGRERSSLLALSLISARKSLWDCQQVILPSCAIGNHFLPYNDDVTCCASYGRGGPWMEGPTDEQRIIAISGCDST